MGFIPEINPDSLEKVREMTRNCLVSLAVLAALAAGAAAESVVVLDETDYFRKHYTFFPPRLAMAAAKAVDCGTTVEARQKYLARFWTPGFRTDPPPKEWTGAKFDASDWLNRRGRDLRVGDHRHIRRSLPNATSTFLRGSDWFVQEVGLLCARGVFDVTDPAAVKGLNLSLTYRGGFVAYLNGTEIARRHLPDGKIDFDTASEPHPVEAFFFVDPKTRKRTPLHSFNHRTTGRWDLRERTTGPIAIKPSMLVKGRNVLAIELHRADYPAECKRKKVNRRSRRSLGFAQLGLSLLKLSADGAAGSITAVRPARDRVQAWTADVAQAVGSLSVPARDESLTPVRIVAARNGSFSGLVCLSSPEPLGKVTCTVGKLKGTSSGRIAPSAATVRYACPNPLWKGGVGYLSTVLPADWDPKTGVGSRLDMLLDAPPEDAKTVGVWLTIRTPKELPAGVYTGPVTITAGGKTFRATIELDVAEWTLPDVKDFVSLINIYQSPETLAAYYKLELWSEKHWLMIERSLKLMGQAGNIGLFIPLLAESQMGNPESMVTWVAKADGSYDYDFTRMDRYVDTAAKHHDRLKFISLNVWGYECRGRRGSEPHGAQVTVRDGATGTTTNVRIPAGGTPEHEAFWKPVLTAIRDRLAKRKLDKLILLGLPADSGPDWKTVVAFKRILPGTPWIRESHFNVPSYRADEKNPRITVPVAYNSIVWGGAVPEPAKRRLYGWRYNPKHLVMTFNRAGAAALNLNGFPAPWSFRMWMESTLAGGRNGNGRVGGDYWVMGLRPRGGTGRISSEAVGGNSGTFFGSYLPSAVGQVGLGNSTTDLFGPGPDGPAPTVRLANALEGNQEAEARICIEKALLDKDAPLPAKLAGTCQALLDERSNVLRLYNIGASGLAPYRWRDRSKRLFAAAGAAAAAKKK